MSDGSLFTDMHSVSHDYDWLERHTSDLTVCREMLREGSHSFYAASLLLPADIREPACALYAFCRLADDEIDDGPADHRAVAHLLSRVDRIYKGEPFDHPADRAMVHLAEVYSLPRELPEALIEGFQWDIDGRIYNTIDDLNDYAARVAGSVGAMMSVLMGAREPTVLARACDLGTAMQLTNIARDVGEDARDGRIYVPRDWMREAGIDPDAWLAAPEFSPQLGKVIARLLDSADVLYQRATSGIAHLPVGCRPGIFAAMRIYREIGIELRRRGCDSVSQRTIVTSARKSVLLGGALLATMRPRALDPSDPLPANAFLVDAVVAAGPPPPAYSYWFS
ncbi:MAG: phytoene/squalene synthase family protein [Pseudomonadota bacterium]